MRVRFDEESAEGEPEQNGLEQVVSAPGLAGGVQGVPGDWRGRVSELEVDALEGFWMDALRYAQWEIGRYGRWAGQDQPVLPGGYDAEGIVQACFERLLYRERGSVPVVHSAEDIRRELQRLVKHRVRWLHERSETGLVVSEWDVLPPREDGEPVSVFEEMAGPIEAPDRQVMRIEKERFLGELQGGFEVTLRKRPELARVFRSAWDGEKRREIAQALGRGTEEVKALQGQLRRRLVSFCRKARGGVKETLEGIREG